MMKKIVVLSTDTKHHRYFINKIQSIGILFDSILFETTFVKPKFEIGPCFEEEQDMFEEKFFENINRGH